MVTKEMYLRDKIKELHETVVTLIAEVETECLLDTQDYREVLNKPSREMFELLHHIECETCI